VAAPMPFSPATDKIVHGFMLTKLVIQNREMTGEESRRKWVLII